MASLIKLTDFLRQYLLRPVSDSIQQITLAAGVSQSFTCPTGATGVILSATDNFYAKQNGAAAIAAGNVTNGTASELNPVGYDLLGAASSTSQAPTPVASIGVISANACVVTASFYF